MLWYNLQFQLKAVKVAVFQIINWGEMAVLCDEACTIPMQLISDLRLWY